MSDEMLDEVNEALALGRERGDLRIAMECQFERGFLHLWRRELEVAEENLQSALELAETCGAMWIRTISLTYLTVVHRFQGQMDQVLDCALRAQEVAVAAHMPDYVAVAKANQAWLAWRRQDLPATEQLCLEALVQWQQSPLVYPFQWQALCPLIAVALLLGREDEAWAHTQALLEPAQQRLPEDLGSALEAALQAKEAGQAGAARLHLDRAMELARELGYL